MEDSATGWTGVLAKTKWATNADIDTVIVPSPNMVDTLAQEKQHNTEKL